VTSLIQCEQKPLKLKVPVFYVSDHESPAGCTSDKVEAALESVMFKDWLETFSLNDRVVIAGIVFQAIVQQDDEITLIKFDSKCYSSADYTQFWKSEKPVDLQIKPIPGSTYMRASSVAVLVVVPTGKQLYTAFTIQGRPALVEPRYLEIPVGQFDDKGDKFIGPAADCIKRELNLTLRKRDMVDLTKLSFGDAFPGVYTNSAISNEYVRLYLYRHGEVLNQSQLSEAAKRATTAAAATTATTTDAQPTAEQGSAVLSTNTTTTAAAEAEAADNDITSSGLSLSLRLKPLSQLWKESYDGKTLAAFLIAKKCNLLD